MPAFWFHYNKPASLKAKKPKITVHLEGKCHLVDNVVVEGSVKGRVRQQQPRFVVTGKAGSWAIKKNIMYLYRS